MDEVTRPSGLARQTGLSDRRWEARTVVTREPRISWMRASSPGRASASFLVIFLAFLDSAASGKASRSSALACSAATSLNSLYSRRASMTNSSTGSKRYSTSRPLRRKISRCGERLAASRLGAKA